MQTKTTLMQVLTALCVATFATHCGSSGYVTVWDQPDAGTDSDSPDGGGPVGSGESASRTIDEHGGIVSVGGATVTIPEGALRCSKEITITETTDLPPAGYHTYSPVYQLEPEGTTFSKPVTISLPFEGSGQAASMFWSNGATGYVWVGGDVTGTTVVADVDHFSKGFVANGGPWLY